MLWKNGTVLSEFILLGLTSNLRVEKILFIIFLIIYFLILIGNVTIIIATIIDKRLHNPMYFFISNLSFLDICFSSSFLPRLLRDLLSVHKTISFQECAAQMYIEQALGGTECFLLAVMAYDRYVAICYPLHYTTIINRTVCIRIATGTWVCGHFISIPHISLTLNVKLCDQNQRNHFVCEPPEILSLGCGNIIVVELVIFIAGVIILLIPVIFIIITYLQIITAILKMTSSFAQKKAFSTCGCHLLVVILFFVSVMATYMKPRSKSTSGIDKLISTFYGIITPMLNPLIYTFRNKHFQNALNKIRIKKMHIRHCLVDCCN